MKNLWYIIALLCVLILSIGIFVSFRFIKSKLFYISSKKLLKTHFYTQIKQIEKAVKAEFKKQHLSFTEEYEKIALEYQSVQTKYKQLNIVFDKEEISRISLQHQQLSKKLQNLKQFQILVYNRYPNRLKDQQYYNCTLRIKNFLLQFYSNPQNYSLETLLYRKNKLQNHTFDQTTIFSNYFYGFAPSFLYALILTLLTMILSNGNTEIITEKSFDWNITVITAILLYLILGGIALLLSFCNFKENKYLKYYLKDFELELIEMLLEKHLDLEHEKIAFKNHICNKN